MLKLVRDEVGVFSVDVVRSDPRLDTVTIDGIVVAVWFVLRSRGL